MERRSGDDAYNRVIDGGGAAARAAPHRRDEELLLYTRGNQFGARARGLLVSTMSLVKFEAQERRVI